MIEGPEWNVYGVIAYDELGYRTVLGGSRNHLASLAMWHVFVGVAGSIPAAPTILRRRIKHLAWSAFCFM